MGGSSSRNGNTGQTGEINQSGGFHVIEIHAPTVGGTVIMIIVLLLIAGGLFWCARRMHKNYQAAAIRQQQALPYALQQQPTGWLPRMRQSLALPPTYKIPEGV